MRTFSQKQDHPQNPVSISLAQPNTAMLGSAQRENPFLRLQRTFGNQAVLRMLKTHAEVADEPDGGLIAAASSRSRHGFSRIPVHGPTAAAIQMELAINKAGDEYEQEADRISELVVQVPEPQFQTACACGGACPKGQTGQPVQKHERLPTKHGGAGDLDQPSAPPIVNEVLSSPGQPLDPATRAFMEPRFGHDFGEVRVHTDATAAQSAEAVNALAYTVGLDLVFAHGQYVPGTREGQKLLAHELAHVIQQQSGTVSRRLVQRAMIPYGQITWADFKGAPHTPTNATEQEGAGIAAPFVGLPTYLPVTTIKRTEQTCRIGKTPSTKVEATYAPNPADFDKPEAQMDQDKSWALERYTGDGTNYCNGEITRCEKAFDNAPAGITSPGGAKINTKAECKTVRFKECMASEPAERARLLRHEQGHFDITNKLAENARDDLRTRGATLSVTKTGCGEDAARDAARQEYETTVSEVLMKAQRDWLSAKDGAQNDYDTQTHHGAKAADQKAWEDKIKGGLKGYGPTLPSPPAAPPATSPATHDPTPRR